MRIHLVAELILSAFMLCGAAPTLRVAAENPPPAGTKVRVLAVYGGHPFETNQFWQMFKDNPDITFWTAWQHDRLLGCGALRALDDAHGEIKSMKTDPQHLRQGVAAALLDHIIDEARRRCYRRLSLETGSMEAFLAALRARAVAKAVLSLVSAGSSRATGWMLVNQPRVRVRSAPGTARTV